MNVQRKIETTGDARSSLYRKRYDQGLEDNQRAQEFHF